MKADLSKAGLYCLMNPPEVRERLRNLQAENRAVFEKGDTALISRMVARAISEEVERFVSEKLDGMDEDARKRSDWLHDAIHELSVRGSLPESAIPIDDQILKEIKISKEAKRLRRLKRLMKNAFVVKKIAWLVGIRDEQYKEKESQMRNILVAGMPIT